MRKLLLLAFACAVIPFAPAFSQEGSESDGDTKEVESLFVAQKAFDDGFYDVALTLLDRFGKNYPSSGRLAEVGLLIGRCYFQQNRFLEALKQFEELQKLPSARKINDALLYWIAEVHFRGNNFERAAGFYKQVVDQYPGSPYAASAYYSLGWCLCQLSRFSEALEAFKVLEDKFPGEPQSKEAPFKIVECLYSLKDYPQLKERLTKYIKVFKNDSERVIHLYYYLAEAEYYLENYGPALEDYARVNQGSQDDRIKTLAKLGMAWSYVKLKRYDDAQQAFSSVDPEKLDEQYQEIYYMGRAVLSYETGRFDDAEQQYAKLKSLTSDPRISLQASLGRADALYGRGAYKDALNAYAGILSASQQLPREMQDRLHNSLAWAYLKEGQFKEAIAEFQKTANQTEDKIFKVSALCQIGDTYQDAGENAKARETYEKILKDYPGSFYDDYVQYQLGIVLIKLGDYDAAIADFAQLRKNFRESKLADDAQYALGLAYFQKKDYASSRDIFRDFQKDYRDSNLLVQALYLYGTSLFNLGEYAQAIDVFKSVIREGADREFAQKAEYEIADCYYQMGNEKEAMARFNQLRVKYPDSSLSAEIMWWLGEYYYRKDDLNLAIRYFSSLIQDFRESSLVPNAYYALGSIYSEEGKFDEAIGNFRKVISLSASDIGGQAVVAVADIYARQEKTEDAAREYRGALERFPSLAPVIYPKLGDLFASAGRYAEAQESYTKSLELVPLRELPGIRMKLAESYQAQGKTGAAVEEYLKVSYLSPEDRGLGIKAMLRAARIYEDQGKVDEALGFYRKIAALDVPEAKFAKERIEVVGKERR